MNTHDVLIMAIPALVALAGGVLAPSWPWASQWSCCFWGWRWRSAPLRGGASHAVIGGFLAFWSIQLIGR